MKNHYFAFKDIKEYIKSITPGDEFIKGDLKSGAIIMWGYHMKNLIIIGKKEKTTRRNDWKLGVNK